MNNGAENEAKTNESAESKQTAPQKSSRSTVKAKSNAKKRSKYFDYDESGKKKRRKIKKLHYNLGWIIFIIFLIFLAAFFLYMKSTLDDKDFLQNWYNEHPEDAPSISSSLSQTDEGSQMNEEDQTDLPSEGKSE